MVYLIYISNGISNRTFKYCEFIIYFYFSMYCKCCVLKKVSSFPFAKSALFNFKISKKMPSFLLLFL